MGCGHILVHQIKMFLNIILDIETTKIPTS